MTRLLAESGLAASDISGFATIEDMAGFIYDQLPTVQVDAAIQFNTTDLAGGTVSYVLWVNSSRVVDYARSGNDPLWVATGESGRLLGLQRAVDSAIIAQAAAIADPLTPHASGDGSGVPTIDITVAAFTDFEPGPSKALGPATLMLALSVAAFPVTGVVLSAILVMTMVTGEKSRRLVGALRTIGLLDSVYWVSWLVSYVPVLLLMALVAAGVGFSTNILYYTSCNYGIHVMGLFLLGTSCSAMALCCASCIRAQRSVNIAAFCFFATGATLSVVFGIFGLYNIIYQPFMPPIVAVLVGFLPYAHYGKLATSIYSFIYTATPANAPGANDDSTMHASEMLVEGFPYLVLPPVQPSYLSEAAAALAGAASGDPSRYFGWEQMNDRPAPISVLVDGQSQMWQDFAPSFNLWMMLVLTVGYILLAWFMGQVFTGDLGAAQPFYFPVSPYYWGLAKPKQRVESGDTIAQVQRMSADEHSVRIHKLSKSYGKATALKEVSLVMPSGQLTALLGQNGAGKSTLIHCLAGFVSATHGEAYIFGKSVKNEMATLRADIGFCPQDDLLWEEISAQQHLALFSAFKCVDVSQKTQHINELLELVQLSDVRNDAVTTFSGGMKRRLSVALSACGSPHLIFLDEPTAGIDPLSRRQIHRMIEQLKRNRVVVLTTHAMEEAEALGDSIAIIANGRLRAYGTPLYLKNRFGSGYQINILTTPEHVPAVKRLVLAHLPGSEFVGELLPSNGDASNAMGDIASLAGVPGQGPVATQRQVQGYPIATSTTPAGIVSVSVNSGGVAGPPPTDLLGSAFSSGYVTVSVPRSLVRELPAFIKLLSSLNARSEDADSAVSRGGAGSNDAVEVQEWGISNSTLEEVFLRVTANAVEVNATGVGGGGGDPVAAYDPHALAPSFAGAGVGGREGLHAHPTAGSHHQHTASLCVLCGVAATAEVVLYTSKSVAVTAPDLICAACATRTPEEIAAVQPARTLAAKPARKSAKPLPDEDANDEAAVAAPQFDAGLGGGRKQLDQSSTALLEATTPEAAPQQAFIGTRKRRLPRSETDPDFLKPVSFLAQYRAALILRMQLQAKQRW